MYYHFFPLEDSAIFLSSLLTPMLDLSRWLLKRFENSFFVVAFETSFISLFKCFCRADLTVNILLHGCQNNCLCSFLIKWPGHKINMHLCTFTLPGLFHTVTEKLVLVLTDAIASKIFWFCLTTNMHTINRSRGDYKNV